MLTYVPSILSFFRAFIIKECWYSLMIIKKIILFVKELFCIYWNNHVIFCPWFCLWNILHLLICICWNILAPLEWNNLIILYDLFDVLLNSVCEHFIENVCIYVCQRNQCVIFFFCCVLFSFGMQVIVTSYNEFGTVPFLSIIWTIWRVLVFFKGLLEFGFEFIWSWNLLCWETILLLQTHCFL
jgi:hypothetical protein